MNDDERLEAHAIVEQLFLRIQVDTEKAIIEARELGERLRVTFEVNQDARGLCKVLASRALGHWLEGKCLAADAAWEKAAEYAGEIGDDREREATSRLARLVGVHRPDSGRRGHPPL